MSLLLIATAACTAGQPGGEIIAIPTTAAEDFSQTVVDAVDSVDPLPPEPTPAVQSAVPAAPAEVEVAEGEFSIDGVLTDIDGSICAQATAVQAELATLREQGEDVSDLEEAVADLLAELENCQP